MGRTSIILGGVALVLLGFILFFERGSVTTHEREERKGRILESFVREHVTRIEIQRKGVTTVLARDPAKSESEDALETGDFRVVSPYAAAADHDAVESLLGALEFITPRRSLGEASAKDLAQFGLDKPRYRVSFVAGRDRGSFSIGAPSGDGTGTYLQTSGDRRAYVVGKDLVEALDREPAYFHSKALHRGVSIYTTQKLRVRDARGERAVERRDGLFWLEGPEPALASEPLLTDLVNALDSLKAARFVADVPDKATSLDAYGLSAPRFTLTVESKSFSTSETKKTEGKSERVELRIGSACAGQNAESYVRADQGPLMCASDADIAKLEAPAADLRERRLDVLDDGQVRSIDVRWGTRQLRVEEEKEGHRYRVLDNGHERESGAVDETALSDWLKSLRGATAESFENDPTQGLGTLVASLTFERGKDKPAYEVRIGRTKGDRVAVSRAGEKSIAWYSTSVLPLVAASAVRFRKARLLDGDPGTLAKLTLSGAGRTSELVTKQGDRYVLEEPVALAGAQAERSVVEEIARLIAKLEAVRFVADAPATEHGLAQPAYVIKAELSATPPEAHTLRIGAAADGGRYAQLDADPAVFVVPPALVRQLEAPLVSRSSLAVPLEQLGSFELTRATGTLKAEPDAAGGFRFASAGGVPEKVNAVELARTLATLRASKVVRYGKPTPDEGFDKPQVRVTIQRRAAQGEKPAAPVTLLFGRALGPEPTAEVYARRSDLDVVFSVPRAVVETLAR